MRLYPLVCSEFNVDFDDDQMAVHMLLSKETRFEALILMISTKNIRIPHMVRCRLHQRKTWF
ncbi:MAG: hypothetical protein ACKFI0_00065 [Candidatus Hodgkinia cicadicola]